MNNSFSIFLQNKKPIAFNSVRLLFVLVLFSFSLIANFYEELSLLVPISAIQYIERLIEFSKSMQGLLFIYVTPILVILFIEAGYEKFLQLFRLVKNNMEENYIRTSIPSIKSNVIDEGIQKSKRFFKMNKRNMLTTKRELKDVISINKYNQSYVGGPYR